LFRRWQRDGTWARILTALQASADAAGRITWQVSVDSTSARAHRTPPERGKGDLQAEPSGGVCDEPADHALGRSRGGLTTKLHLSCEQGQKPLSIVLTAGQRGDSPAVHCGDRRNPGTRLSGGRPRTRPDRVLADKAYASRANRAYLRRRGIKACIPSKSHQDANRRRAPKAAGHQRSTPRPTPSATPWSAASTGSDATAASPPGTTNSPYATRPPCTSPRSTNGSDWTLTSGIESVAAKRICPAELPLGSGMPVRS
jgi:transposase